MAGGGLQPAGVPRGHPREGGRLHQIPAGQEAHHGLQDRVRGQPGGVRRPHPGGGLHQAEAEADAAKAQWSNWNV